MSAVPIPGNHDRENAYETELLQSDVFQVPTTNTGVVEIDLAMPPDIRSAVDLLKREKARLAIWNSLALNYWVRGHESAFCSILTHAKTSATRNYPQGPVDERHTCDLLANYHCVKLSRETNSEKREKITTEIRRCFEDAEKCAMQTRLHNVGHAFLLLQTGQIKESVEQFKLLLEIDSVDQLALQGSGMAAFQLGDFRHSLDCFRRILVNHPNCSAEIRLGIGHCFFKLGHMEKAKLAFQRALQLDKTSAAAMIGLAVIFFNEGTTESAQKAEKLISDAYAIDQNNPATARLFAEVLITRGECQTSVAVAETALEKARNHSLKAEIAYQLAKSYHVLEVFDSALEFYQQATESAQDNFVLPWYGLGQVYLQRNERGKAVKCFKRVLTVCPRNTETLRILGFLCCDSTLPEERSLALICLKEVVAKNPKDIDALMTFAQLLETSDKELSLDTYLCVLQLCSDEAIEQAVQPQLYNNISVLCFLLDRFEDCDKFLNSAISYAQKARPSMMTTMKFNKATLEAKLRNVEGAEDRFEQLILSSPQYSDSYLRLGCLARDKGDLENARDWLEAAAGLNPACTDAYLLLGNLYLQQNKCESAQLQYETALAISPGLKDTYALLGLGNVCLQILCEESLKQTERKRFAERAFSVFRQVLHCDPSNLYAVNGIGAVLAKAGFYNQAQEMFSIVTDFSPNTIDGWLNAGHVNCERKDYALAVKNYEGALKCPNCDAVDPNALMYLGRAQFLNNNLKEARRTLQLALRTAPNHNLSRFYLAVVLKQLAVMRLKNPQSRLSDVSDAIADLEVSCSIFTGLAERLNETAMQFLQRTRKESKVCEGYLKQSSFHLERAKRSEFLETKAAALSEAESSDSARQPLQVVQQKSTKKREAVAQQRYGAKDKQVKQRTDEVVAILVKKRNHRSAQLEEECEKVEQVTPPCYVEPKRKRAKAITVIERRRRKVAERKRREQQIENKYLVSSDEENTTVKFYPRRKKPDRPEDSERSCKRIVTGSIALDLTAKSFPQETAKPERTMPEDICAKIVTIGVGSSDDEKISSPETSHKQNSEVESDDAIRVRRTSFPQTALVPCCTENSVESDGENMPRDLGSRKSSIGESDDSAKRQISDNELESRKRKSSLRRCDSD